MREKLLLEPTATAQWKKLLENAKQQCNCQLNEDIESYLIFTLMRFTQDPAIANTVIAPDYLTSYKLPTYAKQQQLRNIGDHCLLLSGLFPQRAEKRLLRVGYYVDIGRSCYYQLAELLKQAFSQLYQELCEHFIDMMDVLQNLRQEPALQPLQALELWQDTGSRNARAILQQNSQATPVIIQSQIRH